MRELAVLEHQLARILRRTQLFSGEQCRFDCIVNMSAGSLSSGPRAAQTIRKLARLADGLCGPIRPDNEVTIRFHPTHYVGHARELSRTILSDPPGHPQIVVSVGGDGTHGEVLGAYDTVRDRDKRLFFLRLPFGTGNDGADAADLPAAVRLLLGAGHPARTGEVCFSPAGMDSFRAFNIGSLGLDAYVAYLTNRLKGRFGGDLYKLIADVMTLLYERIVGSGPSRLVITDETGAVSTLEDVFLLMAVGVSGYRRYGGGKLVLPGPENVCAIRSLGMIGKIRLKSLFYRGDHVNDPRVSMRTARRIEIHHARRIPMQLDGETVWLEAENFPLIVAVTRPEIPVLALDQSNT